MSARDERQAKIFAWAQAAFSRDQATSLPQRGLRLLEEAIEAAQAVGVDPEKAHALIDYVYARPVGELGQELGGVGVTVLALSAAAGLSADGEEQREVERVLSKPIEEFTGRNAAKNAAGFLASAHDEVARAAAQTPHDVYLFPIDPRSPLAIMGAELDQKDRALDQMEAECRKLTEESTPSSAADDKPSIAELQELRPALANGEYVAIMRLIDAAPVLLEIAAAALALREQKEIAAKARFRVFSSLCKSGRPADGSYAAVDIEDKKLKACQAAYDAALGKVTE